MPDEDTPQPEPAGQPLFVVTATAEAEVTKADATPESE